MTILHYACLFGTVNQVKGLLTNENIDSFDEDDQTPLVCATINGMFDIIKELVKSGADVNKQCSSGYTALHHASYSLMPGRLEIMEYLIKNGADVNVQNNDGDTPLHMSIAYRHPRRVSLLLNNGADPYIANNKGQTAFNLSSNNGEIKDILDAYCAPDIKEPDIK